jgi:hypothetical protein
VKRFTPHGKNLFGEAVRNDHASGLGTRFVVPPFSVLNAREGWWQERKRAWLDLGIKSEVGRGEALLQLSDSNNEYRYNKEAYVGRLKSSGLTGLNGGGSPLPGTAQRVVLDAARAANPPTPSGKDMMSGFRTRWANAAPGGSPRPAANYGKTHARGDGAGRAIAPRTEKVPIVAGNGWGNGGPARRDAAFYAKKRAWEKANGRTISTTEFREDFWDGAK